VADVSVPVQNLAKQYVKTVLDHEALVALKFGLPGPRYRHAGTWIESHTGRLLGQEPRRPSSVPVGKWSEGLTAAMSLGWLVPLGQARWMVNEPVVVVPSPEGVEAIVGTVPPALEAAWIQSAERLPTWTPLLIELSKAVYQLEEKYAGLSETRTSPAPDWPQWPTDPVRLDPLMSWINAATQEWVDMGLNLSMARLSLR